MLTLAAFVAAALVLFDWAILLVLPNYRTMWSPDAELGYRNRPDSQTTDYSTLRYSHRLVHYFTGRWGERVATPGGVSELRRPLILCHGDSLTFCQSVPWDESFPARLPEKLKPAGVVNFGVAGYTAYQSYLLACRTILALHPDLLIFQITTNDDRAEIPVKDVFDLPFPLRSRLGLIAYTLLRGARGKMQPEPLRSARVAVRSMLDFVMQQSLPMVLLVVGYPPSLTPETIALMTKAVSTPIGFLDFRFSAEFRYGPKGHLNARGNDLLAAELSETIQNMGVLHR